MNNIENIDTKNKMEVAKTDKITSAKMLQSTKDLIDTLNLEGNQQEKLDTLVKGYKIYLEQAQGMAKEEVEGLDLTSELTVISKAIDAFVKGVESKTANYINDAVAINISNIEKDFSVKHSEFIKYLDEVKELAVSTQLESEEKAKEIEEFVSRVDKLNEKIEELNKENLELKKRNTEHEKDKKVNLNNIEKLKEEKNRLSIKLESKIVMLDEETLKNSRLNNTIIDYKSQVNRLNQDIKDKQKDIKNINEDNSKLEIKNKELEVSVAELKVKNSSLEEENQKMNDVKKEIFEKTEEITQLEKRNQTLENDLKEFNTLKIRNIELEGTVNALKAQNTALNATLNTINSTIDTIVKSRDEAEKRASNAENEIQKLLAKIKKLEKDN